MSGRFECPIEWCAGYRIDHGASGGLPDEWLHAGIPVELGAGFHLIQEQEGSEAATWALYCGDGPSLLTARSRESLSAVLGRLAETVSG